MSVRSVPAGIGSSGCGLAPTITLFTSERSSTRLGADLPSSEITTIFT